MIVSALLVRRNSSAAIVLPSISSVNFRLSGSPSAKPQIRQPVAARRHFRIGIAADVEQVLRPDVDAVGDWCRGNDRDRWRRTGRRSVRM